MRHQTAGSLRLQFVQHARIDAREHHKRAETVNGRKQQGDEDSLTQILNLPAVLQCLYKLFHFT